MPSAQDTPVDLTKLIGLPGGPRDNQEAGLWARREEQMSAYDHLGARDGDDKPPSDVKPDCACQYCRFYRGEGGLRLIMCGQDWDAIPSEQKIEISESVND